MKATRICSIPDCGRPVDARSWCKTHWMRWKRHGDPLGSAPRRPERTCDVDGCDAKHYGAGLCANHYARRRRTGSLHDTRAESRDAHERFEERVDRTTTPDGCHLWIGPPNGAGYGYFKLDGRSVGAHVAACLLAGVEVPAGFEPDHLCLVKLCVRLDHLEVVTAGENKRRAVTLRWGTVPV